MSENNETKVNLEKSNDVAAEKIYEKNSYTTFEGRLNRLAFCIMGLKALAVFVAVCFIAGVVFGFSEILGYAITSMAIIAFGICNLSLTVRRFHDLNRSGWWAILLFIPWVDLVAGLYVIFAPGTVGRNDYGEDPLREV